MEAGTGDRVGTPRTSNVEINDLVGRICREHEGVETGVRATAQAAVRCGHLLIEARSKVKHGEWDLWVRDIFHGTPQTASTYTRLARANPKQIESADSIRGALQELAAPSGQLGEPIAESGGELDRDSDADADRPDQADTVKYRQRKKGEKRLFDVIGRLEGIADMTDEDSMHEHFETLQFARTVKDSDEFKELDEALTGAEKSIRKIREILAEKSD